MISDQCKSMPLTAFCGLTEREYESSSAPLWRESSFDCSEAAALQSCVGYLNVWLRVAFPIAVRRLTFCSLDWPQQRFKQRFFSHKIEMKSNADTKYYPTHRDEVTCFGLLLICTSSPPSSQEREPLRAIPLKEIHKVQECKQRSVSLPVGSVFGLIQRKFTKTSPLCPPASTWWGTTCSRWSPAQEPSTYR